MPSLLAIVDDLMRGGARLFYVGPVDELVFGREVEGDNAIRRYAVVAPMLDLSSILFPRIIVYSRA